MQASRLPRSHGKSSTVPCLRNKLEKDTAGKKVLALDLDETLVHCEIEPFQGADVVTQAVIERQNMTLYISKRPGLEEFLERMSKCYTLYLYTSGLKEYAEAVLRCLRIDHFFEYVYHRRYCRANASGRFVKNLAILEADPKSTILVDDLFIHVKNQPSNILIIRPFENDKQDSQLSLIANFLEELADHSDVRPVMQKFSQYKDEIGSKSPISMQTATITRSLKTKFMTGLNTLTDASERCERVSQSNFRGIDENQDRNKLETRLFVVKKLSMSPKRQAKDDSPSGFKKPLFERIRKTELEESAQDLANLSAGDLATTRISENSSSAGIAKQLPVMLTQSQYPKFKLKSSVLE